MANSNYFEKCIEARKISTCERVYFFTCVIIVLQYNMFIQSVGRYNSGKVITVYLL